MPIRIRRLGSLNNLALATAALLLCSPCTTAAQSGNGNAFLAAAAPLPDAPGPQSPAASPTPKPKPCLPVVRGRSPQEQPGPGDPPPCPTKMENWYEHFVRGPQDKPLTPRDKAWLAARNMVDPFNTITILGEAAISVGADSHSPYGPGMPGYGKYVGVSFCQDLTGEFFGTFLIPSIAHQDPHYHRMEHSKIPRRISHAIAQVVWTQGDNGKGMLNYANIVGFAIDDQISNLYVPGRETNADATASRYVIGLASAPIGNFIVEFLPDVARHIHVQVVVIQRIINQVARNEGGQP